MTERNGPTRNRVVPFHAFCFAPAMGDRSIQERLRELLGGAEAAAAAQGSEPGTFACSGPLTRVNPGLEVDGAGKVALPLEAAAVGALQAACTMAPFGSGEQTIVDPAVRHTWQADPELLEITNPSERGAAACHAPRLSGTDSRPAPGAAAALYQQRSFTSSCSPLSHGGTHAGWEEEVVPEAVRLAKASLGILPDTGEHLRLQGASEAASLQPTRPPEQLLPLLPLQRWRPSLTSCFCTSPAAISRCVRWLGGSTGPAQQSGAQEGNQPWLPQVQWTAT